MAGVRPAAVLLQLLDDLLRDVVQRLPGRSARPAPPAWLSMGDPVRHQSIMTASSGVAQANPLPIVFRTTKFVVSISRPAGTRDADRSRTRDVKRNNPQSCPDTARCTARTSPSPGCRGATSPIRRATPTPVPSSSARRTTPVRPTAPAPGWVRWRCGSATTPSTPAPGRTCRCGSTRCWTSAWSTRVTSRWRPPRPSWRWTTCRRPSTSSPRPARSRSCWAATTPSRSPTSPAWQSISATAGSR